MALASARYSLGNRARGASQTEGTTLGSPPSASAAGKTGGPGFSVDQKIWTDLFAKSSPGDDHTTGKGHVTGPLLTVGIVREVMPGGGITVEDSAPAIGFHAKPTSRTLLAKEVATRCYPAPGSGACADMGGAGGAGLTSSELIQELLLHRFAGGDLCTQVGPHALVQMNPNKSADSAAYSLTLVPRYTHAAIADRGRAETRKSTVAGRKSARRGSSFGSETGDDDALPPHVFRLAASAYNRAVRTRDSSFVYATSSGPAAGTSHTFSQLLTYATGVASNTSNAVEQTRKIIEARELLSPFISVLKDSRAPPPAAAAGTAGEAEADIEGRVDPFHLKNSPRDFTSADESKTVVKGGWRSTQAEVELSLTYRLVPDEDAKAQSLHSNSVSTAKLARALGGTTEQTEGSANEGSAAPNVAGPPVRAPALAASASVSKIVGARFAVRNLAMENELVHLEKEVDKEEDEEEKLLKRTAYVEKDQRTFDIFYQYLAYLHEHGGPYVDAEYSEFPKVLGGDDLRSLKEDKVALSQTLALFEQFRVDKDVIFRKLDFVMWLSGLIDRVHDEDDSLDAHAWEMLYKCYEDAVRPAAAAVSQAAFEEELTHPEKPSESEGEEAQKRAEEKQDAVLEQWCKKLRRLCECVYGSAVEYVVECVNTELAAVSKEAEAGEAAGETGKEGKSGQRAQLVLSEGPLGRHHATGGHGSLPVLLQNLRADIVWRYRVAACAGTTAHHHMGEELANRIAAQQEVTDNAVSSSTAFLDEILLKQTLARRRASARASKMPVDAQLSAAELRKSKQQLEEEVTQEIVDRDVEPLEVLHADGVLRHYSVDADFRARLATADLCALGSVGHDMWPKHAIVASAKEVSSTDGGDAAAQRMGVKQALLDFAVETRERLESGGAFFVLCVRGNRRCASRLLDKRIVLRDIQRHRLSDVVALLQWRRKRVLQPLVGGRPVDLTALSDAAAALLQAEEAVGVNNQDEPDDNKMNIDAAGTAGATTRASSVTVAQGLSGPLQAGYSGLGKQMQRALRAERSALYTSPEGKAAIVKLQGWIRGVFAIRCRQWLQNMRAEIVRTTMQQEDPAAERGHLEALVATCQQAGYGGWSECAHAIEVIEEHGGDVSHLKLQERSGGRQSGRVSGVAVDGRKGSAAPKNLRAEGESASPGSARSSKRQVSVVQPAPTSQRLSELSAPKKFVTSPDAKKGASPKRATAKKSTMRSTSPGDIPTDEPKETAEERQARKQEGLKRLLKQTNAREAKVVTARPAGNVSPGGRTRDWVLPQTEPTEDHSTTPAERTGKSQRVTLQAGSEKRDICSTRAVSARLSSGVPSRPRESEAAPNLHVSRPSSTATTPRVLRPSAANLVPGQALDTQKPRTSAVTGKPLTQAEAQSLSSEDMRSLLSDPEFLRTREERDTARERADELRQTLEVKQEQLQILKDRYTPIQRQQLRQRSAKLEAYLETLRRITTEMLPHAEKIIQTIEDRADDEVVAAELAKGAGHKPGDVDHNSIRELLVVRDFFRNVMKVSTSHSAGRESMMTDALTERGSIKANWRS
ncbi:unnamed protein product [Amoebophrya sp. A25]|nr:unnamed protein product [Amoebophrya sp. A25]|eukprot:GSA25T00012046001.1